MYYHTTVACQAAVNRGENTLLLVDWARQAGVACLRSITPASWNKAADESSLETVRYGHYKRQISTNIL